NNHQDEIDAIQFAINQGANVIDTAEMYGDGASEELIGEAIQSYDREKLYIISKVHPENASRDKVLTSIDNSLKRLRTDYIDLYLLHWKSQYPLEETISAFEETSNVNSARFPIAAIFIKYLDSSSVITFPISINMDSSFSINFAASTKFPRGICKTRA